MFDYASPPPLGPSPDAGSLPPVPPSAPPPMMQPPPGGMAVPQGGFNGIPGATGAGAPGYPTLPGTVDPAKLNYTTETQQDGTVLLRVQNPDGTPGPVVQIVKPSTPKHGAHGK